MHGVTDGRSMAFLEGLTQAAHDLDVTLSLQQFRYDQEDSLLESLKRGLSRDENLSGVLLMHRWSSEMVQYLADRYDCISLVHHYPCTSLDVVDMNHVQGISQLMGQLHQLGHRRIGFIGLNADLTWAKARFGGYSQNLYSLDLPYNPDWIVDIPTELLEEPALIERWEPMIDRVAALVKDGVTAWMGSSDWVGYALCRGLLDRGFRVPQDVSITGFDTDEPQALGCPRLTSVQVPKQQMGAEALERLLRRRDGTPQAQHTSLFECALSQGQTTASPHV
jgi:LacI family transcriptional regulator